MFGATLWSFSLAMFGFEICRIMRAKNQREGYASVVRFGFRQIDRVTFAMFYQWFILLEKRQPGTLAQLAEEGMVSVLPPMGSFLVLDLLRPEHCAARGVHGL